MNATQQSKLVKLTDTELTVRDKEEDVRGRAVVDPSGQDIGKVDALLVDETESKVRFLQVASGGFLGMGKETSLIPVDAITRIDPDHVHIGQSRERVAGAPDYDPTLAVDDSYYGDVYGYYGYTPFWGVGYAYPAYPYYHR
jgi:sporulation protein YlmC with PRC-barrel domain